MNRDNQKLTTGGFTSTGLMITALILVAILSYFIFIQENRYGELPISNGELPISIGLDPDLGSLAKVSDLPLDSQPAVPMSVKFLTEHRSALNGKTVNVKGIVVGTVLGEKACPPCKTGPCPAIGCVYTISLADSKGETRNKLFDLTVLVDESEREIDYPIGKTVEVEVIVSANTARLVVDKIYSKK